MTDNGPETDELRFELLGEAGGGEICRLLVLLSSVILSAINVNYLWIIDNCYHLEGNVG
jgi:hypothetical protein